MRSCFAGTSGYAVRRGAAYKKSLCARRYLSSVPARLPIHEQSLRPAHPAKIASASSWCFALTSIASCIPTPLSSSRTTRPSPLCHPLPPLTHRHPDRTGAHPTFAGLRVHPHPSSSNYLRMHLHHSRHPAPVVTAFPLTPGGVNLLAGTCGCRPVILRLLRTPSTTVAPPLLLLDPYILYREV
ncbi:hypothetical protein DAEQUDRAFT_259601 [Daedalea quercina L-15889]|uniref:Uncharacterized protein n=1 Tax=Daedalea quercina L-15889 TaxID=1314783 RepID=A0A165QKZ9_9APHY|nr:hypothetical protein DAEQUDRAFT_259601 [Daedalea quercina L-15889]